MDKKTLVQKNESFLSFVSKKELGKNRKFTLKNYQIPNPQVKTNIYAIIVRNNPKTKNIIGNKLIFLNEIL